MSIGTFIDGVGGGGFGVTERGAIGDNLATDKGRGQTETVLSCIERCQHLKSDDQN